jgi:F0F1-type ATP synthase assembly protein I
MPPELQLPGDGKNSKPELGFGRLPLAFDQALRWGLTLAVSVLLGFLLGRWLDLRLNTTPLFLLIGMFWGLGGSFYSIYLQIKKMEKDDDKPEIPKQP